MADQVRLHGLPELKALFNRLPERLGDRVVMAALRAAAQVIRKEAMLRVPVLRLPTKYRNAGTVRKAITVRKSQQSAYAVFVGVKRLKGRQIAAFKKTTGQKSTENPDDPFYWWWLEFGTSKLPAAKFLRGAFEAKKFEALRKFEEYMKARIEREAIKLAQELGLKAA